MAISYRTDVRASDVGIAPLLKWSAVLGGLVLGLALLLLLSSLWLAVAYGSEVGGVRDNVEWYIGGSAIASLFVAGILTGFLSGVRGAGTGMLHGFALWGLLIVVAITVGVPSILNVFGLRQIADEAISGRLVATGYEGALWVTFWTILGGFVASGVGGMLGGMLTRTGDAAVSTPSTPTHVVVPDDRDDHDGAVPETTVVRH